MNTKQKRESLEQDLSSMLLSPVEERNITFGSETEEKSSTLPVPESKTLRRKSDNVDLIEATTGVDVDADDEGDDEQEDNDVTFGAEVRQQADRQD